MGLTARGGKCFRRGRRRRRVRYSEGGRAWMVRENKGVKRESKSEVVEEESRERLGEGKENEK